MTHTSNLHRGKASATSSPHLPLSRTIGVLDTISCVTIAPPRRSTAAPSALTTATVAH